MLELNNEVFEEIFSNKKRMADLRASVFLLLKPQLHRVDKAVTLEEVRDKAAKTYEVLKTS